MEKSGKPLENDSVREAVGDNAWIFLSNSLEYTNLGYFTNKSVFVPRWSLGP